MYHIYKNGEEVDKVKYWADVVKYAENEGFSRRYDCRQSDTNHWYFININLNKAIEVKFKDE